MIASPLAPVAERRPPTAPAAAGSAPGVPLEIATPVLPRACNLLLLANPGLNQFRDFTKVAGFVREYAPEVRPVVAIDQRHPLRKHLWAMRPTFAFSAVPVQHFRPR